MSENPVRDAIQDAIADHEVILFMKGTPERPMCGFSARTSAALEALGAEYAAVDILPDPRIRQELSAVSNWPTLPPLFVKGAVVDYVEGLQGAGFKVDNPNVIAACGCGSSFRVAEEEEVSAV
jgi:Grx4 family monothiol glutaredoxin